MTESIVLKTRLDSDHIETPRLSSVLNATNGDANAWLQQQVEALLRDCGSSIAPASSATASATTIATGTAGIGAGSVGNAAKCAAGKQNWSSLSREALKAYATECVTHFATCGIMFQRRAVIPLKPHHKQPFSTAVLSIGDVLLKG